MAKNKKNSGLTSPSTFNVSQMHGARSGSQAQKMIYRKGFEDRICRLYFKACRYPAKRIEQFPTDEDGFIAIDDLELRHSIRIIERRFDPAVLFDKPTLLCELYYDAAVDILILNDFDSQNDDFTKQKHGGFALASFPNIGFESIFGTVTVIAGDNAERIIVGKTTDIFATLAAAAIIL